MDGMGIFSKLYSVRRAACGTFQKEKNFVCDLNGNDDNVGDASSWLRFSIVPAHAFLCAPAVCLLLQVGGFDKSF